MLEIKSRFLATMSHELRTPLNGIIPATELLKKSPLDAEQLRLVKTIDQSSRSLLTIVDDILDLARVEEGRLEPRRVPFNDRELAEGVAGMLHASAREKGLTLACDLDPTLGKYVGDEDRIRQILVNLIGNTIKFTETGGITVRSRLLSQADGRSQVLVEVEDTGIGIRHVDHDRVFERFEQAEGGLTRRFGGSGLGLAITRSIARALGGEIGLRSAYGKGSTFHFTLPLEDMTETSAPKERPAAQRPEDASPFGADPAAPLDILVADDDEINLEITSAILRKLGLRSRTARNGQEAVEAVTSADFDLVLMDVHMPTMDGLEATRRIRDMAACKAGVKIVALTASVLEEDVSQCLGAGMDDVLCKPITIMSVRKSLEKWQAEGLHAA